MGQAFAWGAIASAALLIGAGLSQALHGHGRVVGMAMGFGAGTLLSAIAYELIPVSNLEKGLGGGLAIAFMLGALVYFFGDRWADRVGGARRQQIAVQPDSASVHGSGTGIFLGALLDGVPESFILGIALATGGAVGAAFLAAVFISNVPEGIAGTLSLEAIGITRRRIYLLWAGLALACGSSAAAGFVVADSLPLTGLYAEAFAAGAVLTMLADSMMPEAFEHGGTWVGVITVFGYLLGAGLSVLG